MLDSVPRYDAGRLSSTGDRAVVIGGSMAGVMAARVLDDGYDEVVVLERDSLPDEPVHRRGVPQAQHPHVLQEAGRAILEDLYPGFGEDLISAGALMVDTATEAQFYAKGGFLADAPTRLPMYCASRPLFEEIVRDRTGSRDGITIRQNCHFLDYELEDSATVTGVTFRDETGEEETSAADLVVDTMGRTSKTPNWLDEHGFQPPPVDEVHIDVAYSTVTLERPGADRRSILMIPDSPRERGAVLFPIEGERWLLTLIGIHGNHPPKELHGFDEFLEGLPTPKFETVLGENAILSDDVVHYRYPTEIRRRYGALNRFPDGLVVLGDAIASFNPFYGQGMSVAALEALALHHVLSTGREDVGTRFFDRAASIVDGAWTIAVGSDFEFPQTTGPKPSGTDLVNRYLARLSRKAQTDGVLAEAFAHVVAMETSPRSLFRPTVLWRVLRPGV